MNDKILIPICDKTLTSDFTTEISMPDYEPEVRRLLRVGVTLTPPTPFSDTSRLGMGGEMIYDILYAAGDGGLYSTRARESYELTEARKGAEIGADMLTLLCEVAPESLISRATAPRKLSLRCKLRGRMRGFDESELGERLTYVENPTSVQRLQGVSEYAHILPSAFENIQISDDFSPELPSGVSGDLRIICHEAAVSVESVEAGRDEAVVKGTAHLALLATVDDAESTPFKIHRKIPFAEVIDADGLSPLCECVATATCIDASFTLDENRISCELELAVKLDAHESRRVEYTRDLFSTEVESQTTAKRYEFPVSERAFSGNFTASLYEPLESMGFEADTEIIDSSAVASVKNIEFDRSKWAITGETAVNFLTKKEGEYGTKEIKLPFRYEVDGKSGVPALCECSVAPIALRTKLDGGRLSVDCELHAIGRICVKDSLEALDEGVFGEALDKDNAVTVCFPASDDSIWEVAKRYHVTTDSIIAKNPNVGTAMPKFLVV